MFNKIVSNSRKTSEIYRTQEKVFNKTRERFFSENSRWVFGKFENQQKTLGKSFWTNFVKKYFLGELSANCRSMFWIFSFLSSNKLFINRIARAVPWNTKPSYFTHGPHKLGPYFKTFSWYGPRIRLINSKVLPLRNSILRNSGLISQINMFCY